MKEPTKEQKVWLQSYFGFNKIPFTKYLRASNMFLSETQSELTQSLELFLDYRGICLISGHPGVGKSITLRRFRDQLDNKRYRLFYLFNLRTTPLGFFRSLARALGLQPSFQKADMFDAISSELAGYEDKTGCHPLLILDDADGLSDTLLEDLRLLTNHGMDSEDRFSLILAGSDRFPSRVRQPQNKTLAQRITYSFSLRSFTVKQTTDYIRFHLERVDGNPDLIHPSAVQLIFHASQGYPRVINQLASHALIQATVKKKNQIDEKFLRQHVLEQSLFQSKELNN
jgi:type II secretory pathway predicted ATPase ExeA